MIFNFFVENRTKWKWSIEIDVKHDDVNCNHVENKDGMKIVNKSITKYKKHIEDVAK
jgi:hypothetical protein